MSKLDKACDAVKDALDEEKLAETASAATPAGAGSGVLVSIILNALFQVLDEIRKRRAQE